MKFKVNFTISAPAVFELLSKILPIEDLNVEEIMERKPPPISKEQFVQLVHKTYPPKKAKRLSTTRHNVQSRKLRLDLGINKVIMDLFRDNNAHKAKELEPLLVAAGYSAKSVISRLSSLANHGIVTSIGEGQWALTTHGFNKLSSLRIKEV